MRGPRVSITEELGRGDDLEVDRALAGIKSRLFGEAEADPPTVGRFVLLRKVGAGGMGVVYECADPQLDRRVALKLVRTGVRASSHRSRLLREAKALAAVAHPNVIAVYDVGTVGEQVFIAMEYVEGPTLRRFCAPPRSVEEIVAVFSQVGRGLAAAHAAGLIHRDLKPDNVIVGRTEAGVRARVLDFGLARRPEDADSTTDDALASGSRPASAVTESGLVLGTPAYMAPEQHRGGPVDARADQFAFCVALYEALCGERPFHGSTLTSQARANTAGRLHRPQLVQRIPAWLRPVVMRGLSTAPQDRYPSMNELLRHLDRAPTRRWRYVLGAGAIASAGAVAAAVALGGPSPCDSGEAAVDDLWSEPVQQRAEAAFAAAGAADVAWAAARRDVDTYADALAASARDNCTATRDAGTQSEQLFELRRHCVEHRRRELAAVVALFVEADGAVARGASRVVAGLPRIAPCNDVAALAKFKLVQPRDPLVRHQVARVRERLAGAAALSNAARYPEALRQAHGALRTAEALGTQAVVAEAQLQVGGALAKLGRKDDAIEALQQAVWVGQEAGHDVITARAANRLIFVAAALDGDAAQGRQWSELARATIRRAGGDQLLEAERLNAVAAIWNAEGNYPEAVQSLHAALEIATRLLGPTHAHTLTTLVNYGSMLRGAGRFDEAIEVLLDAVQRTEQVRGAEHPDLAVALLALAGAHQVRGAREEAAATYARVREVLTANDALHSVAGVTLLGNLAPLQQSLGEHDKALATGREALAGATAILGEDHPSTLKIVSSVGAALHGAGRYREALEVYRDGLSRKRARFGADNPELIPPLRGVGLAAVALGDAQVGREHLYAALKISAQTYPDQHPQWALMIGSVAQAEAELGDHAEAVRLCEAALTALQSHGGYVVDIAKLRFTMAKALRAGGREPMRALSLARDARPVFAEAYPSMRDEVDSFIAAGDDGA